MQSYKLNVQAYFHLLDGHLNDGGGNSLDNNISFLRSNGLITEQDICCGYSFIDDMNEGTTSIYFKYVTKAEIHNVLIVHFTDNEYNYKDNMKLYDIINKSKYIIIQVQNDKHTTSVVFYLKNNSIYFISINSGEYGSVCHTNNDTGDNQFLAFVGIKLCDNFNDKDECIHKMQAILLLGQIYKLNDNMTRVSVTRFVNILNQIKKSGVFKKELFTDHICNIKIEKITRHEHDIKFFDNFDDLMKIDPATSDHKVFLSKYTNYYYVLLHKYLITTEDNKVVLDKNIILNFDRKKIDKMNIVDNNTYNNTYNNTSDIIKNKINLHVSGNSIVFYAQQSGSCSWFSIYWALLLYYIIYYEKDSIFKYNNLIRKILHISCEYVKKVFTREKFIKEYMDDKQIVYMQNLCQKLVLCDILDKSYLNNIDDIIYEISFELENKEVDDNIQYDTNLNSDFDKIFNQPSKFVYFDFLEFLFNNTSNSHILSPNQDIYTYINNISVYIWKMLNNSNNIKFSNKIINLEINFIEKILDIEHNEETKKFYSIYSEIINKRTDKIYYLMLIYDNIIKLENENKTPSFLIQYYHYLVYMANINNLKLTEENIINYSYYIEKINILFNILNEVYTLSKIQFLTDQPHIIDQMIVNLNKYILSNILINIDISIFKPNKQKYIPLLKFSQFYLPSIIRSNNFNYELSVARENVFILDTCDIKEFIKYNEYLLRNPHLIYDKINESENIDDIYLAGQFIKINIHMIFDNNDIRDILLRYFCEKYYTNIKYSPNTSNDDIIDILSANIHYLLDKTSDNRTMTDVPNMKYMLFLGEPYFIAYGEIAAILKKLSDEYNITEFCDYIIKNKDSLTRKNRLDGLLKKYFQNFKYTSNNNINIDGVNFKNIHIDKNHILIKTFTNTYFYTILLSEKKDIIYILDKDYKIKLNLTVNSEFNRAKSETINLFKINTIFLNDLEAIKVNTLNIPFIHTIPKNFIYFITKKDDIYNITYFITSSFQNSNNVKPLLLKNIIHHFKMITIPINPNNLFFADKMKKKDYDDYINLFLDGGINNYNYMFVSNEVILKNNCAACITNETLKTIKLKITSESPESFFDTNNKKIYTQKIILSPIEDYSILNLNLNKNDVINSMYDSLDLKFKKSIDKLLIKISKCTINNDMLDKTKLKFQRLISNAHLNITNTYNLIKNINVLENIFLKNYDKIYEYMQTIKILNICNDLNNSEEYNLCSKMKIYSEQLNTKKNQFKYVYENLFEIFFGNEISEEQYDRYIDIINSFNKYQKKPNYEDDDDIKNLESEEDSQTQYNFPLHHFMMGKGKSSVITPLLTLYFTIIHKKTVYIIVPEHLKNQTDDTMYYYINVFNVSKLVHIKTDTEIKNMFLDQNFKDTTKNNDYIFLIDEFDSIIDPLKSNYNRVLDKTKKIQKNIINIVKTIVELIYKNGLTYNFTNEPIYEGLNENQKKILLIDINNIIEQIKNNKLVENINWGIDLNKLYAVPYMKKDKPLKNSNFSSCILTLFLTYYYFICVKKYSIDEYICNYINNNKLQARLFNTQEKINIDFIDIFTKNDNIKLFDDLFDIIISTINLSNEQHNVSFIDIINIENIFKIGYSGTLNIELPDLYNDRQMFKNITEDYDEETNIQYAILNSNIKNLITTDDSPLLFINEENISEYDSIIDVHGLFKDYDNEIIAKQIYETLKRPVIYLDKFDNKQVYIEEKLDYHDSEKYTNAFIYYSQTHTIGVDIKQDNYPNMKGLCIINMNNNYTTIAQAIFRLRKINLGHEVDFFIINNSPIINNQIELYNVLKKNDDLEKNNKHNPLMFQTLKALVRKRKYNNSNNIDNIDIYSEKIKYYFENSNYHSLLDGILDITNLTHDETKIYDGIRLKLFELVYNIKYDEINIQQNTEIESEKMIKNDIVTDNIGYMTKYDSFDIYLTSDIYKDIYKYSIPINADINILLNLFSLTELVGHTDKSFIIYKNIKYKKNPQFLFAYSKNKLIIVSDNMIRYLYDKYVLLDLNLHFINFTEISHLVDDDFHNKIKIWRETIDFIKIFDTFDETNIELNYAEDIYTLIIILMNMNMLSIRQKQWLDEKESYIEQCHIIMLKSIDIVYSIIEDNYKLIPLNITKFSGGYKRKYIKYIKKYNI